MGEVNVKIGILKQNIVSLRVDFRLKFSFKHDHLQYMLYIFEDSANH